jgi:hypothetical protein
MRFNEGVCAVAAGVGCAVLAFGSASAQDYDRGRNVSVLERERKDYDASGIHVGSFSVFPKIEAQVVYSSNVFADDTNKQSDYYYGFDPTIEARSNWNRHQLQAEAGLKLRRYSDFSSEDQNGWFARANGRLDVFGTSYLKAGLDAERSYEERGGADFPGGAAKPLPYDTVGGALHAVGQFNRLRLTAGGEYHDIDYKNVPLVFDPANPTLTTLDTSGRDRKIASYDVMGEWAISPDTALFGKVAYVVTNFNNAHPPFSEPDSDETTVSVGANFDLSALLRGEIGAGYVKRKYDDPAFGDVSGLSLKGQVEWFPTQVTTVTFNAHRSVQDSVLADSSGYFETAGGVRVDHELRRNILVNALVDYENDDFNEIDRTDKVWSVSAGGTYLLNRIVGINANLGYINRDSSGLNRYRSYDETRASIGIILQR